MSQHSRHNDPGAPSINLGLIVTPMLDMSFQILAFFIMTYHPSILEGHVNGQLVPPKGGIGAPIDPKPKPEPPTIPDPTESVEIVVKAVPKGGAERQRVDGEPAQIYLKKVEDVDAALVSDSDEPLDASLKRLASRLKAIPAGMAGHVRLECQGDLKHQYVMQVYDVCRSSGFQNVSFVAPVATNKR